MLLPNYNGITYSFRRVYEDLALGSIPAPYKFYGLAWKTLPKTYRKIIKKWNLSCNCNHEEFINRVKLLTYDERNEIISELQEFVGRQQVKTTKKINEIIEQAHENRNSNIEKIND